METQTNALCASCQDEPVYHLMFCAHAKAVLGNATYLERGVPEGVDVHRHHPHLPGIIALQVDNGPDAPGIAHVHPQPEGLAIQHVQQTNLQHDMHKQHLHAGC